MYSVINPVILQSLVVKVYYIRTVHGFTEALPTVNFQDINQGHQLFDKVEALSEDFPLMVTEYWSGWFDHWGSEHHTQPLDGNILTWSDFKHKNRMTCGMVNSF